MPEHPILFSTPMVRAILSGQKTQTRRVVARSNSIIGEGGDWDKLEFSGKHTWVDKPGCFEQPYITEARIDTGFPDANGVKNYQYLHVPYDFVNEGVVYRVYPRYQPGDRLWVRETWADLAEGTGDPDQHPKIIYKADATHEWSEQVWHPSIFLPRLFSRITLEITAVKVERGQEISELDAINEGIPNGAYAVNPKTSYAKLWNSINGKKYPWASNPWVWVISFKRLK
jgi:hypothetical protein